MANSFPLGNKELKIGILGMKEGNAHPYSWSAMINGCDCEMMSKWIGSEFPVIPAYLGKQPASSFGIPGTKITHICFTGHGTRKMAEQCAEAAFIPNVADRPGELIGEVDAVICAADDGSEHVERCRPFIEAGIPVFIDKTLADCEEDLQTFVKWHEEGARFIASSHLRYAKEMQPYYEDHYELGELKYLCSPMVGIWDHYGMHSLEGIFPLLGPGFEWVRNCGTYEAGMVHLYHRSGCDIDIPMGLSIKPGWCVLGVLMLGTLDSKMVTMADPFYAFKKQLEKFVHFLRTGEEPVPFEHVIEMNKVIIAGIRSQKEGGRKVMLDEIKER